MDPYADKLLLTAKEICSMCGIGTSTFRKYLLADPTFPKAVNTGKKLRYRKDEVLRFIARLPRADAAEIQAQKDQELVGKFHDRDTPTAPIIADVPTLPEKLWFIKGKLCEYSADFVRPCVYFLMRGSECVYVGQTTNLPVRVSAHRRGTKHTPVKDFDRVFFVYVEAKDLNEVESDFIKRLKPIYNIAQNSAGPY